MSTEREPGRPYTRSIDLTSRAKLLRQTEQAAGSFMEPEPALPEVELDDLPSALRRSVETAGWPSLMPVQRMAIPYLLAGRDLIVQSRTGSGKTGAFLLPLFEQLDPSVKAAQALILSPTRELAKQIHEEFERIRGDHPLEAATIYGGVRYGPQLDALERGAQVVVGTPGRILDHLQRRTLKLDRLRWFVLDEADEMLSMGFFPDMMQLKRYLPTPRHSAMFSATIPPRVRTMAGEFLVNPGFLSLSTGTVTVDSVSHRYYRVDRMDKDRALVRLIEMENPESAIIFANTKREVEYLGQFLSNYGYDAAAISGDLSQAAREQVMGRIRRGALRFMVATDVAARGIDITDLSHVFMVDVPRDQEYYVHRAGRTARAGKTGKAMVLATIEDEATLKRIAHKYGFEMERAELPDDDDVAARVNERMTVTLESRFRDKSNLNRERLRRFVPMVEELAREEPELLAMLIDELYHATLHGAPEGSRPPEATRTAEQEAAPSGERTGRGRKGRRRGRRSDSDHSAD